MKKPMLDSEGDPILNEAGEPTLIVKDKHRPTFRHLGNGRYEFFVPAIDDYSYQDMAYKLGLKFGDAVVLLKPAL